MRLNDKVAPCIFLSMLRSVQMTNDLFNMQNYLPTCPPLTSIHSNVPLNYCLPLHLSLINHHLLHTACQHHLHLVHLVLQVLSTSRPPLKRRNGQRIWPQIKRVKTEETSHP